MATESDSVNAGALATIVAVGALVTLAVALAVTALVRSEQDAAAEAKNSTVNDRPFRELRAEQVAQLTQPPAWVDKAKGVVSIPLARAMELVVSDYIRDPELATPVSAAENVENNAESADQSVAGSDAKGDAADEGKPSDSETTSAQADSAGIGADSKPEGTALAKQPGGKPSPVPQSGKSDANSQ